MSVEEKAQQLPLDLKMALERDESDGEKVLEPETYDEIDALVSALASLVREVCEYYGIHSAENRNTGKSNLSRVLRFNTDKIEFYNAQQDKLIQIAKRYNLPSNEDQ